MKDGGKAVKTHLFPLILQMLSELDFVLNFDFCRNNEGR